MKCTMLKMTLENNEEVELTLNFARLLKVKNHNKKIYEDFMTALKNTDFDIVFDSLKVLYIAYLCANSDKLDGTMSESEFIDLVPMDFAIINGLVAELIQPKKK